MNTNRDFSYRDNNNVYEVEMKLNGKLVQTIVTRASSKEDAEAKFADYPKDRWDIQAFVFIHEDADFS